MDNDGGGLQIAMNEAKAVYLRQCPCNVDGEWQKAIHSHRAVNEVAESHTSSRMPYAIRQWHSLFVDERRITVAAVWHRHKGLKPSPVFAA
ncbi:hypothetical protein GCM10027287_40920 [Bordetella muralis]